MRRFWWAARCAICCWGSLPKDFDVATNALPDEVRRLFRNCRLIGRRFRLAHVHFGSEIIEVATFRAAAAPEREDAEDEDLDGEAAPADESEHRAFDTTGRILRDNIYGTIEEDVWRRDFAANGLYYNIEDFSIWDFVDGVGRRPRAAPEADRRSGDPLPRGSGAHAARRALRREARFLDRSGHRAADSGARVSARRRAAGAIVR